MRSAILPRDQRSRGVTAVLGPTNTGKTHLAIERMLGHSSGLIGLPLRLLAREVYQRLVDRAGPQAVALITGEEKIKPEKPRYWVATAEAMPRDLDVAFLAIDEIQLAADADRGHVFTDIMLNRRGREETLIIGSGTMRPMVENLLPGANIISRPRLSKLTYAGEKKITRLPGRAAIVAFSAEEVYAIAELLRRQRGGAAVVLGALSPRTRNAQVEMFQNGDVDLIVATDAIGMGLNLDIDHVAFAAGHKFDGYRRRKLSAAEFGQIAGRAGRHTRDGTFGTTGRAEAFEPEMIDALENHIFEPVRMLNWRNPDLDFRSVDALVRSLGVMPQEAGLSRAMRAEDEQTLELAAADAETQAMASSPAGVRKLWELCQLPDYRKVAPQAHAELAVQLYGFVMRHGSIPDDWFQRQVAGCDRTDGDIETLSARIAQVRTWTFCANRDWLRDPEHWQGITRAIEDKLSDALHERLAQRFVDRRTSVLMRRLRENAMLEAEVTPTGDVRVEGQHVGHLQGFRFTTDATAAGPEARALHAAAQKALLPEIDSRAARLSVAGDDAFALALDGAIRWLGEPVAKLQAGEKPLEPRLILLADDLLNGAMRESVESRLGLWLRAHISKLLGPLQVLDSGEGLEGMARGVAYQVAEHLGVVDRATVANDVKGLGQEARASLRKLGLRFGAYHVYVPALLKPAPRALAAQLWTLKHPLHDSQALQDIAHLSSSGRTSMPATEQIPRQLYRVAGFRVCGPRAIRVDILERLADLIRPAIAFKPGTSVGEPPPGAHEGDGFTVTVGMTSLVGCAGEDFAAILKSLGYRSDKRPPAKITVIQPARLQAASAATPAPVVPAGSAEEAGQSADPAGLVLSAEADQSFAVLGEAPDAGAEPAGSTEAPGETVAALTAGTLDEPPATVTSPAEPLAEAAMPLAVGGADLSPLTEEAAAGLAVQGEPETGAETAPAEVELVDVWRPGRFERDHGGRREHHRGARDGQRRDGRGPQDRGAQDRGGQERTGQERGRSWQGRRNGPAEPGAVPPEGAATGEAAHAPAARHARPQQERPGGQRSWQGGPRGDRRRAEAAGTGEAGAAPATAPGEGRDRPAARDRMQERGGHERGGQQRPGQERWQNRGGNRSADRAPERPRQERQPDPDSPFAALLALKAQLEAAKKT
jgi:ATP-dependent RNA helicase SUPV3L1/SUV3